MPWSPPAYEPPGNLRQAASLDHWSAAAYEAHARHGLTPAAPPRMFGSGSVVVLDCGATVFKLVPPCWADEIGHEARVLGALERRLSVETPRVVACGELEGWAYALMTRLDGVALGAAWPSIGASERRRLAAQLGELSACLHALSPSWVDAEPWDAFLWRMRSTAAERHARTTHPWRDHVVSFLDSVEPMTPGPVGPLHTELLDEHVLVTERDGRWELSGLIDFADARRGHHGYEVPAVVEFVFRGERPLLADFLRAAGVPRPGDDMAAARELLAWGLLHQFGSVPRMVAACGDPPPASLDELATRLYGIA